MDQTPSPGDAPAPAKRWALIALGVAAVAAAVFGVGQALRKGDTPAPRPIDAPPAAPPKAEQPRFRNTDPAIGYIGSAACAECHTAEHASFHATPHAQSVRAVDPAAETLPAAFHHERSGIDYEIQGEDGAVHVRESITLKTGDVAVLNDHPLAYAFGTGTEVRIFAAEIDGFLVESPASWYPAKKSWGVSPGYDTGVHPGFSRPLDEMCLSCHVGQAEFAPRSINRVKIVETSISCERCHGPGALHAELHRGPQAPPKGTGRPDDTIVSLRRMSPDQQMDVCAQCHMDPYMTIPHAGKSRLDWRPGMPWEAVQTTFRPTKASIVRHEFAGQVDALRESACFQKSGTLTCVTCHGVHGAQTPEAAQAHVHAQCMGCHEACARTPGAGEPPVPAPAQDDCVACHMPSRETANFHASGTRHDIGVHLETSLPRIPPPPAGAITLVPLAEADDLSEIERLRNLGLAFLRATARTDELFAKRAYASAASTTLESARARGSQDPEVVAALGWLDHQTGAKDKAVIKFRQALALGEKTGRLSAASRVPLLSILVDMDMALRQVEAPREHLEALVLARRDPEDWLRLARMRHQKGDEEGAAAAARMALAIWPNEPGFQFQAGDLLGLFGHPEEKARCDLIGEFIHVQQSKEPPK